MNTKLTIYWLCTLNYFINFSSSNMLEITNKNILKMVSIWIGRKDDGRRCPIKRSVGDLHNLCRTPRGKELRRRGNWVFWYL